MTQVSEYGALFFPTGIEWVMTNTTKQKNRLGHAWIFTTSNNDGLSKNTSPEKDRNSKLIQKLLYEIALF